MSPRTKNLALFGVKAGVAAALLSWLVRSGSLDFGALGKVLRSPTLMAYDVAVFVSATILSTLRWGALLRIVDVRPRFFRLLQLQLSALFFNVVIPGAVGGDVVKNLYVARDAAPEKRPTILLIVFVERVLGLSALLLLGSAVVASRARFLFAQPLFRPMAAAVLALGAAVVVGAAGFLLVMRLAGNKLVALTQGSSKIAKLLGQLVGAMHLVAKNPAALLRALLLSVGIHVVGIAFFTKLAQDLAGQDVGVAEIATVFPLGIISLVLPVAPSGLGVGHVAFDKLFQAIGLEGGATVFNVFLLGQIVPYLTGVIPYLMLKREAPPPAPVSTAAPEG